METLKVLYKNGFAVCDSIFGVLIKKTNTWRGFEIPFVILKLPTAWLLARLDSTTSLR